MDPFESFAETSISSCYYYVFISVVFIYSLELFYDGKNVVY